MAIAVSYDSVSHWLPPQGVLLAGCALLLAGACSNAGAAGGSESDAPRRASSDVAPPSGKDAAPTDVAVDTATQQPDSRGQQQDTANKPDPKAPVYPLTPDPYTTLQKVWAPLDPPQSTIDAMVDDKLKITDIDKYDQYGLGVETYRGQPWVEHNDLAAGYNGPNAKERRSLLYFWQSADPQLIDEESPIRFEGVTKAPMGSTYRPQDHLTTQVYESHVRTARRISEESGRPFDFALITGDMTDGGQKNEIQWAFDILNGGVVDPDSGVDDDPVSGEGNDFTDPFWSRGIGVPWYMAIGNHETLYTGVLSPTEEIRKAAVGGEVYEYTGKVPGIGKVDGLVNGFRDASTRTAEVVTSGKTPADEDREILRLPTLLEKIHGAGGKPEGHGIALDAALDGEGYYSFRPLPGKPIRVIVLNTLMDSPPGHASGALDGEQFDWLKNELSRAKSAHDLVIVSAHHRAEDFTRLSEVGGGALEDELSKHENVILYLVGHGHNNAMKKVVKGGNRGYWELMCASTVDYPMQTRIFEIAYDGDGYLSVYVTNIEQNAPDDSMAHKARELAAARRTFLWGKAREHWKEQHDATNLLLRYKIPSHVAKAIEEKTWPKRVESLETLRKF